MTTKTGQQGKKSWGQECWGRTARTGKSGQESLGWKAWAGKPGQDSWKNVGMVQPRQEREDRMARTLQKDRAAGTGQL
jgi:hypothetical protein